MKALSGAMTLCIEDHRSYHRVGRGAAAAAGGQLESALHPVKVVDFTRPADAVAWADPSRSRRNLIASPWNARS
jgi:hypothetical protein